MGELSRLCHSADLLNSSDREENLGRSGVGSAHDTLLAEETLVSSPLLSSGRSATLPSTESRHLPTPVGDPPPSASGITPDRLASIGEDARTAGLSARASQFIIQNRRDSTRVVYNSRLEAF